MTRQGSELAEQLPSASIYTEAEMSNRNRQFHLPDGRRLGYDERGAPDGKPVFYLHGSPSSRVEFSSSAMTRCCAR
jgi:hypothetical protein